MVVVAGCVRRPQRADSAPSPPVRPQGAPVMRVKIHPHKSKVNAGVEQCVSITPDGPGGKAYYQGTVVLKDAAFRIHGSGVARARREQVRNVHAWCVGEITDEYPTQVPLDYPAAG